MRKENVSGRFGGEFVVGRGIIKSKNLPLNTSKILSQNTISPILARYTLSAVKHTIPLDKQPLSQAPETRFSQKNQHFQATDRTFYRHIDVQERGYLAAP